MSEAESENKDSSSSHNSDDEDNSIITEEERKDIRQKISTLSFEDLLKMKEEMGSKLYNETVFNVKAKRPNSQFKRANKNRPREMSSKIKPRKHKHTLNTELKKPLLKNVPRDPRFDPLCGQFDAKQFKSNYKFINELRIKDRKKLAIELKKCSDLDRQKTIKYLIQRMDNQMREEEKHHEKEQKAYEEKKDIKEKLKKGEKPMFKKKSVKKLESLIEKYENLKKNNKLQKHILKRNKKLSVKDKKMIES